MPKVDTIQTAFVAGELGPSLYGRTDVAQYQNACQLVENFLIRSYGPAISTPGTKYVYTASNATLRTKLLKFVFNRADAYVIEMGKQYFRFYTNGGIVVTTGTTPFVLAHTFTENELDNVQYTQLNDVIYLAHPDHIPQKLTRKGAASWTIADFAFIGGPFLDYNLTTTTLTPSATTGTINITASTTGIFTLSSGSTKGHVDSYWAVGGLAQTSTTTGLQEEGYVKITHIYNTASCTATVIKNLKAATATTRWAEGAWNAVRGYPARVIFHERRLWFARTAYEPQKIWGSKTFEYENFALDSEADDDGVNLGLASNESNEIQWIASGRSLIAGTYGGAFILNSKTQSDPITPTNATATEQVGFGSNSVTPRKCGSFLYYLQRFGEKLRELFYNFDTDTFKAVDRTILSPHILGDGVIDMDLTQNPESILYCVLTSGTLVTMTRETDQEVTAWARQTTAGTYSSVAIIPSQTDLYDEVWVVVERWIGGAQKKYIEVFDSMIVPDRQDLCNYVHSGLTYNAYETSTSSTITISVGNSGHIVTTVGTVSLSPVIYKLGTGSVLLDGSTGYLTSPDSDDWQLGGPSGSALLDGATGYMTSADSADWQLGGGTGDFTIDCWVRFDSITAHSAYTFLSQWEDASHEWIFDYENEAGFGLCFRNNGVYPIKAAWSPVIDTWYHVSVVRTSNVLKLFVNGTQIGVDTVYTDPISDNSAALEIGAVNSSGQQNLLDGYLDEVRISDTARWATNFTAPTAQYASDSNTKLLLHINQDFTDSSTSAHTVTTAGTVSIDKAQFVLTKDFTIDFWVRFSSVSHNSAIISQEEDTDNYWILYWDYNSNKLGFVQIVGGVGSMNFAESWTPVVDVWYHVAFVRTGNDFLMFVNGSQIGSTNSSVNLIGEFSGTLQIGASEHTIVAALSGYIDEFRISSIARWTANFDVPTTEYSYNEYARLLLHLNTNFVDSSTSSASTITITASSVAFSQAQVGKRIRGILSDGTTDGEGTITKTNSTSSIDATIVTPFNQLTYAVKRWGISVASVSGLDHLEAKSVKLLVDGQPDETDKIVASGAITLTDDYFVITAGLGYDQIIYTLPKEAASNRGTAQGKIQRINEIAFKINRSYPHFYAGGNSLLLDIVSPTISTIVLTTGTIQNVSFRNDYRYGSQVYIENSVPLPIELLNIIATLETFDK